MPEINITYCITTFNKIDYLKTTLPQLINSLLEDEEIIVSDGGSKDGTKEYLKKLHEQGKIHMYFSEPDKGEAHGLNKTMLAARGKLIKIMSDDDAFYLKNIRHCKTFMLNNPQYDVLGSEGLGLNGANSSIKFFKTTFSKQFREWKKSKKPFFFCGLSLIIRKNSLPLVGLFHTGFTMIDFEYIARLASGKANIVFYTGYTYVNIVNEKSNSVTKSNQFVLEQEKVNTFYFNERKKFFKKTLHLLMTAYISFKKLFKKDQKIFPHTFLLLYTESEKALLKEDQTAPFEFI